MAPYPCRKSQVVFRAGVNRMYTRFPQPMSCFAYSVASSSPPLYGANILAMPPTSFSGPSIVAVPQKCTP